MDRWMQFRHGGVGFQQPVHPGHNYTAYPGQHPVSLSVCTFIYEGTQSEEHECTSKWLLK